MYPGNKYTQNRQKQNVGKTSTTEQSALSIYMGSGIHLQPLRGTVFCDPKSRDAFDCNIYGTISTSLTVSTTNPFIA